MKAEIKILFSPDIEEALKDYQPEKAESFGFLLQILAGPKGEEGEESFDLMVCTPDWLKENHSKEELLFGRHYMIVFEYDYQAIYKKLAEYINSIEANTWDEIANQIGRIAQWEFEDYKV